MAKKRLAASVWLALVCLFLFHAKCFASHQRESKPEPKRHLSAGLNGLASASNGPLASQEAPSRTGGRPRARAQLGQLELELEFQSELARAESEIDSEQELDASGSPSYVQRSNERAARIANQQASGATSGAQPDAAQIGLGGSGGGGGYQAKVAEQHKGAVARLPRARKRRSRSHDEHASAASDPELKFDSDGGQQANSISQPATNDLIGPADWALFVDGQAAPSDRAELNKLLQDVAFERSGQQTGRSRLASRYVSETSGGAGEDSEELNDHEAKLETIYFGGFFPSLADNDLGGGGAGGSSGGELPEEASSADEAGPAPLWGRSRRHQLGEMGELANEDTQEASRDRAGQPSGNSSSEFNPQPPAPIEWRPQSNLNYHQQQQQQQQQLQAKQQANSTQSEAARRHHDQLGKFILPAVQLALDHINRNNSILSSYRLEIVPRDTQCNATISLKKFFDMVYEEPKKMLLYGDACRVSTDPIAKASYFFDLIQISYADTDPIYTIENYPNFFRVVPSENALSSARIPFVRHFNWTRVGTIYQNLPRYSLPHSKLLTDLERYRIVIKQTVSLPGSIDALQDRDLGDELRKLKDKDVRIILGNFDEKWALLLFCEAYRERMTGRKYQWILTGISEDKLWQHYREQGSQCSKHELQTAMDGYILTDISPVTRSQKRTISGLMAHEYSREYQRRVEGLRIDFKENKFYGYVYDGVWAIALALNRVDEQIKYFGRLQAAGKINKLNSELAGIKSLKDFNYSKPIWARLIRNALNRTRFDGVTGTVSFLDNERPGLITFAQFQAFRGVEHEVIIGSYDALGDQLDLQIGYPIYWRGSSPPIDYTIQRVTPFRINRTLFVIISIFAILGIILAFTFLTINIKFRNQRYIKMSSPYLNNLIIIGCILTYTSVIILGLDSGLTSELNFPYICKARAWILMAGFTLAFGSMFSKTFRVHSIFTNIKLHKKVIKDYKLFMVVFILLTFDFCILIVWQYFDPFYRETNNGTSLQDLDNEDIIIVPEMEHCQSKRMTVFLSIIYVYKGLLMAFGCFLAWETRHVSIPALNDSKYIGLSVYNVVIMCVIGAGLSFVLRDQQDASFVIISIFIIFCSTTTLCLVFVPKVRMLIELKQNPKAGEQRVRATLKTFTKNYKEGNFGSAAGCRDMHGNLIGGRKFGVDLDEKIKFLQEQNTKQRLLLREKIFELDALTIKYRKLMVVFQSGEPTGQASATASAETPAASLQVKLVAQQHLVTSSNSFSGLTVDQLAAKELGAAGASVVSVKKQQAALVRLPIMSSLTQISTTQTTTTTTTSSGNTNNTLEFTLDCNTSSSATAALAAAAAAATAPADWPANQFKLQPDVCGPATRLLAASPSSQSGQCSSQTDLPSRSLSNQQRNRPATITTTTVKRKSRVARAGSARFSHHNANEPSPSDKLLSAGRQSMQNADGASGNAQPTTRPSRLIRSLSMIEFLGLNERLLGSSGDKPTDAAQDRKQAPSDECCLAPCAYCMMHGADQQGALFYRSEGDNLADSSSRGLAGIGEARLDDDNDDDDYHCSSCSTCCSLAGLGQSNSVEADESESVSASISRKLGRSFNESNSLSISSAAALAPAAGPVPSSSSSSSRSSGSSYLFGGSLNKLDNRAGQKQPPSHRGRRHECGRKQSESSQSRHLGGGADTGSSCQTSGWSVCEQHARQRSPTQGHQQQQQLMKAPSEADGKPVASSEQQQVRDDSPAGRQPSCSKQSDDTEPEPAEQPIVIKCNILETL